jgi:sec-independent protein translocase protein TatB
MFDISWSELLILGIVTLIFVGPKELPVFLRTLGRYAGTVRRHANDFKAQFDAAMREAELDSMRKEVEQMRSSVNAEVMRARTSMTEATKPAKIDVPPSVAATLPTAATSAASSQAAQTSEEPPRPATPADFAQTAPASVKSES